MSKHILISFLLSSLALPFFSDSHIGDEEKKEAPYMNHPPITSFTNTPKEGRVRLSFNYTPPASVSESYDASGEIIKLDSSGKYTTSSNSISIDYFGYKRSGISMTIHSSSLSMDKNADISESRSMFTGSVYFIWGNKFSFPVQSIKSEFGFSDSLGILIAQSVDYRITDRQMWTSKISATSRSTSTDLFPNDNIKTMNFSTKLIYNLSEMIGASIEYRNSTSEIKTMGISATSKLSSISVSAGLQLTQLRYGYYGFKLRLQPSLEIPLSGENQSKQSSIGLNMNLDFI